VCGKRNTDVQAASEIAHGCRILYNSSKWDNACVCVYLYVCVCINM